MELRRRRLGLQSRPGVPEQHGDPGLTQGAGLDRDQLPDERSGSRLRSELHHEWRRRQVLSRRHLPLLRRARRWVAAEDDYRGREACGRQFPLLRPRLVDVRLVDEPELTAYRKGRLRRTPESRFEERATVDVRRTSFQEIAGKRGL